MAKSKKIDKIASIEKLEYIRENVTNNLSESRVEACVDSFRKEKDINTLLRLFSEMNIRFADESDTLREQAPEYNKKYTTTINGRFTVAYNSLSCIRTQVFFLYRIMNAVSSKPTKQHGIITVDTSSIEYAVNHTMMGNQPYSESLFNNPTESQKRLIAEIISFVNYLDSNLELCLSIVKEEERIANDEKETLYLFEKQLEEVFQIVKNNKKKVRHIEAEYYQDLIDAKKTPALTMKWFHQLPPDAMCDVALGYMDQELSIYTPLERKTFNEDPKKLNVYRIAVSHLDEVVDKITGEVLVYVQQYTGCTSSQSGFHKCFTETYSNVGGQLEIVTYARFNQACTAAPHHIGETSGYLYFELRMNKFVYPEE